MKDDIGLTGSGIASVLGPDGVKVELLQVDGQTAPIAHQHIHFFHPRRQRRHAFLTSAFRLRTLFNDNQRG